jgi:hypothetical protein
MLTKFFGNGEHFGEHFGEDFCTLCSFFKLNLRQGFLVNALVNIYCALTWDCMQQPETTNPLFSRA